MPIVSIASYMSYSYYDDFLYNSPGSYRYGLLGYINPANISFLEQSELIFSIVDDGDKYGLFSGMPGLGFGVISNTFEDYKIKDYRLSTAMGNKDLSIGFGFGWSSGDTEFFRRDKVYTLGAIYRPAELLSLGLVSSISDKGDREAVIDIGIRPFGNDRFSLFADLMYNKIDDISDDRWSAGFSAELIHGLTLTGRYISDKSFSLGMQLSFGRVGIGGKAIYDDERDHSHNSYSIRFGGLERCLISNMRKSDRYLSLDLKGDIRYRKYRMFDRSATLWEILSLIESARIDDSIEGIFINTSGMAISPQMMWEIREKLIEFQKSGKKLIVYIDRPNISAYHMISSADRIIMDPWGTIMLEGYASGRTYMKNFLDMMGIGFTEFRLFDYKSAAETASRESMSEYEREQSQRMVDLFYETVRSDINNDRGFSNEEFDRLVNEIAMFDAGKALEYGLIDDIRRFENIDDYIKENFDNKPNMISKQRFINENVIDHTWGSKPAIALVYALGPTAMDMGINARTLHRVIRRLKNDNRIKAIILRVDSPGGDGLASDLVADAIKEAKKVKPVIISQGYVAASGGYWISMDGDIIVTSPKTITGSIGVIGGWIYDDGISEKTGLTYDSVRRGNIADLGRGITLPLLNLTIPYRNVTEEEQDAIESYMLYAYEMFVQSVADARDMSFEDTEKVSRGRIWIGQDAIDKGLSDELGGLQTAIDIALSKLELEREDVVFYEYPKMGLINFADLLNLRLNLFGINVSSEKDHHPLIEDIIFRLNYNGIPIPMLSIYNYDDFINYMH